jgi:hypothetical protein
MEKLDEYWSTKSVTSKFQIHHKSGRPVGCEKNCKLVYSKTCGLGWRFAILYDNRPPEIEIFFESYVASIELGRLNVVVMLQAQNSSDEAFVIRKEYSTEPANREPNRMVSWKPSDISRHSYVTFKVSFSRVDLDIPKSIIRSETHRALEHSLQTGVFIDTKFYVFSKRLQLGRVGRPLALFASSALLQEKSIYMTTHMSQNRPSDSAFVDLGSDFMSEEDPCTHKYDYELDSDLDEDDLADDDVKTVVDGIGSSSDVWEDTVDAEVVNDVRSIQCQPPAYSPRPAHFQSIGRTILVNDTAFKTWQALILYLYSGNIEFLPLKSGRSPSQATGVAERDHLCHPCSPKSMYRLATKLGLDDLKNLAFKSIRAGLSKNNILNEAFSEFTSRYPPILEMEVNILSEHFNSPEVSKAFPAKFKGVTEGKLPHSSTILTSLFQKLAKKAV